MIMMDATVVNTALPVIGDHLSASVSGLQWVVDGYTLVFACLLLSGGSLGDRLGARRMFLAGLTLFTVASCACGLAPTLVVLGTARVVQGVGAALVLPTSLALIHASYPDRASRVRAIGLWGGFGGVAAGLGPALGGLLTTWVGWPAIFFVNLPVGVAAITLTLRHVPAPDAGRRSALDPVGQVLAVVTVAALAYGLIERSPVAFAVAAAGGIAFVAAERRHRDPMLPPALFGNREFSGAIVVGACINIGFYGQLFLLTLLLQQVRHFAPLLAGLALLPMPAITSVASLVAGRHNARHGARRVMATGLTVGALGLFGMTLAASAPYPVLVVAMLALGFGTGYTMPAATAAAIEAAPATQAGTASGAFNASRQLGSTLGVAVFGALVGVAGGLPAAYRMSAVVGCLVFAGAAVVALCTVPARNIGATEPVHQHS